MDAALIKALAMMERNDTSHIFVLDEGTYRGTITIQGIAASMSELAECTSWGDADPTPCWHWISILQSPVAVGVENQLHSR